MKTQAGDSRPLPTRRRWEPSPYANRAVGLGPFEVLVMRVVWNHDIVTARDVYEELRLRRHTAYTTVMTTLGNLVRKGLLVRYEHSRTFTYRAKVSDAEVAESIIDLVVDEILGGDTEPLADHLHRLDERRRRSGDAAIVSAPRYCGGAVERRMD